VRFALAWRTEPLLMILRRNSRFVYAFSYRSVLTSVTEVLKIQVGGFWA